MPTICEDWVEGLWEQVVSLGIGVTPEGVDVG